jgi:hypothetical protein
LALLVGVLGWGIDNFILKYWLPYDIVRIGIVGLVFFVTYISISYLLKISALLDFKQLVLKR